MAELIDKNLALTTLEEVEKFAKEEGLEWANGIHRAIICIGAMQGSSEQEIRTKAIEEFAEKIKSSQNAYEWCCHDSAVEFCMGDDCEKCVERFKAEIDEIAESIKGEKEC